MILIVPMLTSGSISPNVLPGLMKAVEKYTIIYGMDSILRSANAALSKSVQLAGTTMQVLGRSRLVATDKMKEQLIYEQPPDPIDPTKVIRGVTTQVGKQIERPAKPTGRIDVNPAGYNTLSLEPTWIQVTTQRSGLQILGIKAIPFPVQSPEGLVNAILTDRASKTSDYLTKKYSRMMIRIMFRIARKVRIPRSTGRNKSCITLTTTFPIANTSIQIKGNTEFMANISINFFPN